MGLRSQRVRYGRARLTIAGAADLSPALDADVRAYEAGRLDASELCWSLVESRVLSHTPSFSWDEAELDRLLALVVSVSSRPHFPSAEPDDVAETLVDAAARQGEQLERLAEKMASVTGFAAKAAELADFQSHVAATLNFQTRASSILGPALARNSGLLGGVAGPSLKAQLAAKPLDLPSRLEPFYTRIADEPWPGLKALGIRVNESWTPSEARFSLAPGVKSVAFNLAGLVDERTRLKVEAGGWLTPAAVIPPDGRCGSGVKSPDYLGGFLASAAGEKWREALAPSGFLTGLKVAAWSSDLLESQKKLAFLSDGWDEVLPQNWRELERDELKAVVSLMQKHGLCLVSTPRPEIVREILVARTQQQRRRILLARKREIIEDVEAVLDAIKNPDLALPVRACRQAIGAYRDGWSEPAQSHVGAAFTHVLSEAFGVDRYGEVEKAFDGVDPYNEVSFQRFPVFALGQVMVYAVRRLSEAGPSFNRNLTLHLLGPHYSEENLLAGLLLVAGSLYEFDVRPVDVADLIAYRSVRPCSTSSVSPRS